MRSTVYGDVRHRSKERTLSPDDHVSLSIVVGKMMGMMIGRWTKKQTRARRGTWKSSGDGRDGDAGGYDGWAVVVISRRRR